MFYIQSWISGTNLMEKKLINMKFINFNLIVLLLISYLPNTGISQCINQNEILTTDWAQNNQINLPNNPKINTFDWTRPYYDSDVFVRDNQSNPASYTTRIHSPFSLTISNRDNPQINIGANKYLRINYK